MSAGSVRNNIVSMVISLALAFCLWVALAGQDMSAVDISVPLELDGLPDGLALSGNLPTSVTIQFLANTAQIRFLSDRKPHLWLDVSAAREGANAFPVQADSLDLPHGVQVRKFNPAVIEFEAVRLAHKTVPIRAVVLGNPDPLYHVTSIEVNPEKAVVTGPQKAAEAVDFISTAPIDVEGLRESAYLTVRPSLGGLDPGLTVDPAEIEARVTVEERQVETTFAGVPIALEVSGERLPDAALAMAPANADISVAWPITQPAKPSPDDIHARVQVDGRLLREAGGEMEAPVKVTTPDGITVTSISPVTVKIKSKLPPTRAGATHGQETNEQ